MKNFLELSFNDINNLKISPKDCVKWATEILQDKDKCVLPEKNSIKFGDNCFFNTMPSYIPFLNRKLQISLLKMKGQESLLASMSSRSR